MSRPVALFDANVLYSAALRDLLIRLARAGAVSARWSDAIHEEWITNLLRNRPDLTRQQLDRTRALMEAAVPGALVRGYERHVAQLELPDPGDRHVLAAAIEGGAGVIVTFNLDDFPPASLAAHGIRALDPDAFVLELLASDADAVIEAARAARTGLRAPRSPLEYLETLARSGLSRATAVLRSRVDEI